MSISNDQASDNDVSFGLFVENVYTHEEPLATRLQEHREQISLAEAVGFRSIVFGQHLVTGHVRMTSPLAHLTSVIDISGGMRLCTGVLILPWYQPVLLAEEIASIDWLCEGRLVLGVGLGYRKVEFDAAGVDIRQRVRRFNESLAVMQAMWSAQDSWTFRGNVFSFVDIPVGLRPRQHPHPPLWVAADVDAAVRRAGRWGAAWYINPRAGLNELKRQLHVYGDSLGEHGQQAPTAFPIRREAFVAATDQKARSTAARYLSRQFELYRQWGQYDVMPGQPAPAAVSTEEIPDTYLVGSPSRVAELIHTYVTALGVNHFVFRMQWPGMPHQEVMKSIEMVGSELIPIFSSNRKRNVGTTEYRGNPDVKAERRARK